jgi:beta-N-acetylhexosaminidase
MPRKIILTLFVLTLVSLAFTKPFQTIQINNKKPDSTNVTKAVDSKIETEVLRDNWVDSIMQTLSLDEKIAQLFMVAAYSNKGAEHVAQISKLVKDYKIGGLIFFQGGPVRQARLTNTYQKLAKVPLLISIDGEWGLAMRLDSTVTYPRQMTLGAIQDEQLIYQMGADIAQQCKRMGIHVNLAPVVDINNNPKNPVINSRSFGEDKYNVARKGIAYMKGMQDNGIMANAKHFPGHGDTDADSHHSLPIVNHTPYRLNELELYPFKELMKEGLGSIMVAHLFIPKLDSTKNQASTLSKKIVTDLLKEELQFKGLIFTDALNMKGVSSYYKPGIVDVKALLAGNDVLLFSEDVPTAINEIKKAIENGEISEAEIDIRCTKILNAKKWVGLNKYKPIDLTNLHKDLNKNNYEVLNRKLYENAMTLVKNDNNLIPLKSLDTLKIASIAIGETGRNHFQKHLEKYTTVKHHFVSSIPSAGEIQTIKSQIKNFNLIIISIHKTNETPSKNFGISKETVDFINEIRKTKTVILDVFGNPYALGKFYGIENLPAVIVSYHDRKYAHETSAELIFGGIKARGKLPVTASPFFTVNSGIETADATRFKYGFPEEFGIKSNHLTKIDDICINGIKNKAFPGCQVLVAKEGNVIYNKSFGYHTYDTLKRVEEDDIYDIASITKIAASTLSLMYLKDKKIIHLDSSLSVYLGPLVDTTAYKTLTLKEMLAHQAGLISWIPFYQETIHKGQPRFDVYSLAKSELYPYRVAENFYINKDFNHQIFQKILTAPIKDRGKYKYSDLGYYFFQKIIEQETQKKLDIFVKEQFYTPMGLSTLGYKPRNYYPLDKITPTEHDFLFRKQLVQGDVHDPGAAMLGGVGGHAGLFSNANDLAKLMQMYLNKGTYGGDRYLSEETINEFIACQFCKGNAETDNRRAAGFDKPVLSGTGGPTCDCISKDSFGHTGFTGTMAWADPDEKVVYIFLSNRVYPNAENKKLITEGHRTQIMKVIYEAIQESKKSSVVN